VRAPSRRRGSGPPGRGRELPSRESIGELAIIQEEAPGKVDFWDVTRRANGGLRDRPTDRPTDRPSVRPTPPPTRRPGPTFPAPSSMKKNTRRPPPLLPARRAHTGTHRHTPAHEHGSSRGRRDEQTLSSSLGRGTQALAGTKDGSGSGVIRAFNENTSWLDRRPRSHGRSQLPSRWPRLHKYSHGPEFRWISTGCLHVRPNIQCPKISSGHLIWNDGREAQEPSVAGFEKFLGRIATRDVTGGGRGPGD
jgi:hypothetical protein